MSGRRGARPCPTRPFLLERGTVIGGRDARPTEGVHFPHILARLRYGMEGKAGVSWPWNGGVGEAQGRRLDPLWY